MGPDVDIEAIFSVIDGMRQYNIENIGELSIYISSKFLKETLLKKGFPSKAVLDSLERDFQRFIRKSYQLRSKYRKKMVGTCTSFFNAISEATNAPSVSSNVKYDDRWTMFTTNYDRCIEAFWRENVQVTLDTGFRSKNVYMSTERTLSADEFLETPGSEIQALKNSSSHFRLVKLHGFTTWLKREDTGKVEELIFHHDQGKKELGTADLYMSEAVIYPLRQKQLM